MTHQEVIRATDHSTALTAMQRAEVDIQISTARKYPRELSRVKQAMMSFATLDEDTAASCFYKLPPRKGAAGKSIEGPSIRLAEIAASCFQNIRYGARVVSDDGKKVSAQGVCHDLENNVSVSVEIDRRVTTRDGQRYSDDMVTVTGNAACAIAMRNAIFKVVPLALIKPVYEQAKKVAVGDARTLADRRGKAIESFSKMGVEKARVLAKLEKRSVEDINLDDLETLIGVHTAIKDGHTSVDEAFPDSVEAMTATPVTKVVDVKAVESKSPQDQLADIVCGKAGSNFDAFRAWAEDSGNWHGDAGSFAEMPTDLCRRLVMAQSGLVAALSVKPSIL